MWLISALIKLKMFKTACIIIIPLTHSFTTLTHSLTTLSLSPHSLTPFSLSASAESMECDNVCEPAQPEVDDNDRGDGGNAIAPASPAAETLVSDALIFVSALKQDFLYAQVWKDRLRQRVRPEEKPPRNPWSTIDPHSVMKGAEKVNI